MNLRGALVLAILLGTGFGIRALPTAAIPPGLTAWWTLNGSPTITMYFSDGARLVPVSRRLPSADNVPHAALQALLDGPSADSGLTSLIPGDARIRSLTVSEDVARIDLSSKTASIGEDAASTIVETMTALPGIRAVVLSVNGTPATSATRTPLLYYVSPLGLIAVPAAARTAREAVDAYLTGPSDPTLTGIPRDVQLLKYEYRPENGLALLDFAYTDSVRTLALEKPDVMRSVLLGLIASLTEMPGITAVRIDFDGHARLGLGECSDLLRTPQRRPRLLNDERLLGR